MSDQVEIPHTFQYMKPDQVSRMRSEIDGLRKQIENPAPGGADKGEMRKRVRRMEDTLTRQIPPDLNGSQRDALAREEKELREEFTQHMPSAVEMRRNPPGVVSKQIEFNKRFGRKVFRWKQIRRLLNPHDNSPDLCSIEPYRPHSRPTDGSMHDAQISGKSFFGLENSEAYKRGWDQTFGDGPPQDDELSALRKELEEVKALLGDKKSAKQGRKVAALCGKEIDPRGVRMHEQKCKACEEAREDQVDQPSVA